ncbi:SDR family NAD(P)-dependent oxidoreductase [Alloyangia pacifica]|uniref:SDR family NAD(P)-dependent oxidoreductase n=1 Tax=Alloyangia pacifica TaxID=311180 RepID=UPI001CFE3DDB|nr:SDR family oxidoreductase [Alloyangia pacifica]
MSDEIVLVTGAAHGIGLACAQRFAAEGYAVALVDRDDSALSAALATLPEGTKAEIFPGDVADAAQVERIVAEAETALGPITALVTSAGIIRAKPSFEVSPEEFREHLDINVTGSFLYAQAVGKRMAQRGGGSIVMIGSVYGASGAPLRAAYCASKGAVHNLVAALSVEWGELGIRVNAVAPTGTRTAMVQGLIDQGIYNLDGVRGRTPLRRLAEPEEIADGCFFLASKHAGMISGHVLPVDGGLLSNGYPTVLS